MPRYSQRTGLLQEYQVGPFNGKHIYVQWGGSLPGGDEWCCGFRMISTAEQDEAQTQVAASSMLPGLVTALKAYHASANMKISSSTKMQYVKSNAIDVDGHYRADSTNETVFADHPGAWGGVIANQIAIAISLTTGFNRGPAHRGRFYIPTPSSVPGQDGLIPLTEQAAMITQSNTMLTAVNALNASWDMGVMSRKAGAPASRLVTGIQVGRVLDTQRRRRNKLAESY